MVKINIVEIASPSAFVLWLFLLFSRLVLWVFERSPWNQKLGGCWGNEWDPLARTTCQDLVCGWPWHHGRSFHFCHFENPDEDFGSTFWSQYFQASLRCSGTWTYKWPKQEDKKVKSNMQNDSIFIFAAWQLSCWPRSWWMILSLPWTWRWWMVEVVSTRGFLVIQISRGLCKLTIFLNH